MRGMWALGSAETQAIKKPLMQGKDEKEKRHAIHKYVDKYGASNKQYH